MRVAMFSLLGSLLIGTAAVQAAEDLLDVTFVESDGYIHVFEPLYAIDLERDRNYPETDCAAVDRELNRYEDLVERCGNPDTFQRAACDLLRRNLERILWDEDDASEQYFHLHAPSLRKAVPASVNLADIARFHNKPLAKLVRTVPQRPLAESPQYVKLQVNEGARLERLRDLPMWQQRKPGRVGVSADGSLTVYDNAAYCDVKAGTAQLRFQQGVEVRWERQPDEDVVSWVSGLHTHLQALPNEGFASAGEEAMWIGFVMGRYSTQHPAPLGAPAVRRIFKSLYQESAAGLQLVAAGAFRDHLTDRGLVNTRVAFRGVVP